MSKKSTNFELLRILMTLFIPIYHWILYNGIFYAPDSTNSVLSLLFFTGVPFSCLYAFIAMSSYFLIKKKFAWSLKKVLSFAALALTLYAFKYIFIHVLYTGVDMYSFIYDFFIHGAWWYVYPYVLLMIFYPVLNRVIYHAPIGLLYGITAVFGAWFIRNSYLNQTIFLNDCVLFLFVYFIMGCLVRKKDVSAFYHQHKNCILICIYICIICIFTGICIYFKLFSKGYLQQTTEQIIQWLHGRYNLFGLVSGITIFTWFKNQEISFKPVIHKLSQLTLYVFLLHETVMSIFWRYEIKGVENLAYLPVWQYFLLILLYLILCIVSAFGVHKVYSHFLAPLWERLILRICEAQTIQKLEQNYMKFAEK